MVRAATGRVTPAQRFFDDAMGSFARAADAAGCEECHLDVAGRVVTMRFAGDGLAPLLTPALEHLQIEHPVGEPALSVALFDDESTGVHMVPAPWDGAAYQKRGYIVGYNDDRNRTAYELGIDILQTFDADLASAIYWTRTARIVPWWESSFPLRTTLHWWSATTPSLQPIHAGAVGREHGGVLIAGRGGAGKSTTALACLDAGLAYAGDDYVLVDVDRPHAYSLYGTAKLRPENLHRFPHLATLVSNPEVLHEQKALLYLYRHRPEQLVRGFPLRAIVLPRITGERDSGLTRATPRDAVVAIAPTTMFQLPGDSEELFAKVKRLAAALPVYWLDAGTDLAGIPAVIDELLAGAR
jgi:hypothetical protein